MKLSRIALLIVLLSVSTVFSVKAQTVSEPEVIAEGFEFTEGPFWHPNGYLLFSDIPANIIYKWHPDSSGVKEYIKPSYHSNGITWDATKERVIVAQHDGRISEIQGDTLRVLASQFKGKRLNSPNDVAVASDGSIYFTDPPFGVSDSTKELDFNGVFRIAGDGTVELLYDELSRPNGIVFSPDEKTLYVNDLASGDIWSFDVTTDGNVSLPNKFASMGKADSTGAADGMVVDTEGRLYSTGPGGIYVFSSSGKQLHKIELPARATNLEWGREGKNELFITTPNAIYRLKMDSK